MALRVWRAWRGSAFKTRKDQTKRLHYDARGREDYHTWDGGPAPRIDRIWDDAGRMTRIWNNVSIIDYSYDEAGQVRTEGTTVTGSPLREVRYCRYPSGEVAQMTYPNGTVVNRFYTARGQLEGVGWGGGSTSYAYWPDGKVNYQARTNGVTTSYGYDGRGMISSVQHRNDAAGHDLAKRDYWRDDRDRILAWKRGSDNTLNQMENGRGNRYGYDEEGQLTSASYRAENPEGTPTGAVRTDSFQYDPLGNRMGMNHVASRGAWMNFTRRDNGLNQYHSWENDHPAPDPLHWGSGIFYDDNIFFPSPPWVAPGNGVTMADGWIVASYNALNQPMAVGNIGYGSNYMFFGYDPLGRCVKRWKGPPAAGTSGYNPATYFYYDGWSLVQESSSAAVADRLYVHGGRVDEMVASQVNGVWYHHHYDAQGNCIMQTTASGGLQVQYDYDGFGFPYFYNAAGGKGAAQTRFLFTGREWLADHRLYDFRARMYQPELGRFLQPDPKQFEAGDYNLYRYCHNDPVNKVDPTGLDPVGRFIGELVGGYVFGTIGVDVGIVALGGTGALAGTAGGPAGVLGLGGTGAVTGAVIGGGIGIATGIKVGGDAGDYVGDKIKEQLGNIFQSRGRDQGERRRQHENPNPDKKQRRDHQTGKKLPDRPPDKPRQPEPEVIPKGPKEKLND